MKKIKYCIPVFLLLMIFMGNKSFAQQFVYTPINPNFGGNYFNGSWMLAEAQAQNGKTAPSSSSAYNPYSSDPLKNFQQSLNQQILSQLSQKIITSAFGESALTKGHYQLGNYIIDINPSSDGLHVNIQDNSNGGQTTIVVPYY